MSPTETRRFSILIYVTANTVPATGFVAYNRNAVSTTGGLAADTDADGLTDVKDEKSAPTLSLLIPMTRMVTATCSSSISSERVRPIRR